MVPRHQGRQRTSTTTGWRKSSPSSSGGWPQSMSHAPTNALRRRHLQVRDTLHRRSLDALVVLALPNIAYLTNFTGSSAIVVLTHDRLIFVTDFRYVTAMADMVGTPHECPGLEIVTVTGSYDSTVSAALGSLGLRNAGFEAAHLTVNRHQMLSADPGVPDLIATEGILESERVRKDAYEV